MLMSVEPDHREGECYGGHMTMSKEVIEELAGLVRHHNRGARVFRTQIMRMWYFAATFDMDDDPVGRDNTQHTYVFIEHLGLRTVDVVKL